MNKGKVLISAGLMMAGSLLMVSCGSNQTMVSPARSPVPTATATPRPQLVDDLEDGDGQIIVQGGRNAYWFSFVDPAGTVWPSGAGAGFAMSAPGSSQSPRYAARITGACASFAGLGVYLKYPNGPYDAGAYNGFTFSAKTGPGLGWASVQVATSATSPVSYGGACVSNCYDNFQEPVTFTGSWAQYTVYFSNLNQQGWGTPAVFDPSQLMTLQWNLQGFGNYDLWIDDMAFVP